MFAWLTGGDNLVAREGAAGVAAAGYDGDNVTVVTSSIEGQRLRDEEVGDDVEVVEHPGTSAASRTRSRTSRRRPPRPTSRGTASSGSTGRTSPSP